MAREQNLAIAQEFLGRMGRGEAPEKVAELFSETLEWEIAGDVGALPWLGRKHGRQAIVDFVRDAAQLIERIRFEVHDILANDAKAVILGELASRLKSNGAEAETAFAIVLTISNGKIEHYRMFEDSFAISLAARAP